MASLLQPASCRVSAHRLTYLTMAFSAARAWVSRSIRGSFFGFVILVEYLQAVDQLVELTDEEIAVLPLGEIEDVVVHYLPLEHLGPVAVFPAIV